LATTHERDLGPADLTRRERRELGVEIRRHREPHGCDVVRPQAVQPHEHLEQLAGGREDLLAVVPLDRCRAADSSRRHQDPPASTRPRTNVRSAAGLSLAAVTASIAALPTATPSTRPRSAEARPGATLPKTRAHRTA